MGRTSGWLPPVVSCMLPSGAMKACPQVENFNVRSISNLLGFVSEECGFINTRHSTSASRSHPWAKAVLVNFLSLFDKCDQQLQNRQVS